MSMNREQLLRTIENPSLLNERTLGELKEILDEFPYFQTAHMLYIKNLEMEESFRAETYLKTAALYATDRTVLFNLLNNKDVTKASAGKPSVPDSDWNAPAEKYDSDSDRNRKEEMKSDLEEEKRNEESFDLLEFEMPQPSGYVLEGATEEVEENLSNLAQDIQNKTESDSEDEKADLIDQFIKTNPVVRPGKEAGEVKGDISGESTREREEFMTETLARIYMKQGHYQKALVAFQKLSLKYPEKSTYFARQIEEIKKLLNK